MRAGTVLFSTTSFVVSLRRQFVEPRYRLPKGRLRRNLSRGAYADENGVSGSDSLASVGGIGDPSGLVGGRENLVEMMFVDRNAAGVELSDALAIDVRTHYLVSCFGKTSSGDESHVSTADN